MFAENDSLPNEQKRGSLRSSLRKSDAQWRAYPGGTEHPGGGVSVEEMRDGHMTGHCYGCSMQLLAWFLSGERTGRPVQDKTGLAGSYDFWLPTTAALDAPATDPSPSVFSVVEGLGLKLVPAKGQVETLVIDHIERPSAN